MAYERIENYGVVGNMRTVALVSLRGSIDWLCFPYFDSPSVFSALLDDEKGGRFSIHPVDPRVTCKQLYWPDTNVLITRFLSPDGVAELQDFMPCGDCDATVRQEQLVRRIHVVRGRLAFEIACDPVFDYAQSTPSVTCSAHGATFAGPGLVLALSSAIALEPAGRGVSARFVLEEGEQATFVLKWGADSECARALRVRKRSGSSKTPFGFPGGAGSRSPPTAVAGARASIAPPWFSSSSPSNPPARSSLRPPAACRGVRGGRNWDYRYTWMRDAAFTLFALLRIGFTGEAARFMEWLQLRTLRLRGSPPAADRLRDRRAKDLKESTLDHLDGYRGSRPVRIGNGAYDQLQLDIYGELMDSVYLFNKYGAPISADLWTQLRYLVNWVCDNWRREDEGIWETRGGRRHFVYSKLMCWVALDRGLRLADKRSFPADRDRWLGERDAIYEEIMTRGWSDRRRSFVQRYDSEAIDASNLIMPLVFFHSPVDPKMLDMLAAVSRSPREGGLVSGGLVYRYDNERPEDGLIGREGTFNMCTFWLVEALTRAGRFDRRKLEEARLLFERMLGYANHLGLYAEQTSSAGEALGNYPQALTHLALISAAYSLDRALNEAR